jgi:putative membrane protein
MPVAARRARVGCRPAALAALPSFAGPLCAVLWMTAPLSAHVPGIVTPEGVWRAWSLEPLVLITLAVTSLVYARGVRRLRSSAACGTRGGPRASASWFAAGQAVLVVALISPLDAVGGTLLSAHMAQHAILAGLSPPLLLLGAPGVAFAWGLRGVPGFRRLAPVWRCFGGVARALSTPMRAAAVHGLAMWLWHAPTLFGAAVEHEWVHALQHLSFFITAMLFWRALLDAHSVAHAAAAASAAFVTFMHTGLLGALITMAPEPLYVVYVGRSESWAIAALADQHLAGLLMWVPLGLPYLVAGLVLTARIVRGHVNDVESQLGISE